MKKSVLSVKEVEELRNAYGKDATSKIVNELGNTVVTYRNRTTKTFYRNTDQEIKNPKYNCSQEQFYTFALDIQNHINKSMAGVRQDMQNLSAGYLIPTTTTISAFERILLEKGIYTAEEFENIKKQVADDVIAAQMKEREEQLLKAAVAHAKVFARIEAGLDDADEIEKAKGFLDDNMKVLAECDSYINYMNLAIELFKNDSEKEILEDSVTFKISSNEKYSKILEDIFILDEDGVTYKLTVNKNK